jgi:Cu-processing system ATP-binding protein
MISIQHINKRFRKLQVLQDVSAELSQGQVVSLIGPNGSGKTTLIKSILGMVRPDSGKIYVKDQLVSRDHAYREHIGYMPQVGRYPDNMKIGQLFKMIRHMRNLPAQGADTDLIKDFELEKIYEKPMRTLSGGTRQKVSAALAFLFDPAILILDEPTAGLDPVSSEILKKKILSVKAKNKLVLISSHILSDLDELTTHVIYMQEGKLQFFKHIDELQEETGEIKLEKAIARIMRGDKFTAREKRMEVKKDGKIY